MAAETKPQKLPSTAIREPESNRATVKDIGYCGPKTANTGLGPSVQKSFPFQMPDNMPLIATR